MLLKHLMKKCKTTRMKQHYTNKYEFNLVTPYTEATHLLHIPTFSEAEKLMTMIAIGQYEQKC